MRKKFNFVFVALLIVAALSGCQGYLCRLVSTRTIEMFLLHMNSIFHLIFFMETNEQRIIIRPMIKMLAVVWKPIQPIPF